MVIFYSYSFPKESRITVSILYSDAVNEKILYECLSWIEGQLEKPAGRQALEIMFDSSPDKSLIQVLLSVASPKTSTSTAYATKVFQFFNKLFSIGIAIIVY